MDEQNAVAQWTPRLTEEISIFYDDQVLDQFIEDFVKDGKITLRGACDLDGVSVFTFQSAQGDWYFIVKNTDDVRKLFRIDKNEKMADNTFFIIPVDIEIINNE